jgi:hypothetical protein
MAVTAEASSAANRRDVDIAVTLRIANLLRMNKSVTAAVNESREFTFTDIANEPIWI